MDVHQGKEHSDNIECGMCEFVAIDNTGLETHLCTCEVYVCNTFDRKFKTMADLKPHVMEKHEKENVTIYYSKQDRFNKEEFTEKRYCATEIFQELK